MLDRTCRMSTMIVDANIAIYWSVPGPYAAPATKIMGQTRLCAPNFLLVETAGGLLKYVRAGLLSYTQLKESLDLVHDAITEFVFDGSLLERASDIAFIDNHKIYDCLYLALAIQRREPLATADRRLAALAQKLSIETELIEPAQ